MQRRIGATETCVRGRAAGWFLAGVLALTGGAWFAAGNVQFHIGIDPEGSPPSKRHVCFLVADLDEARDKARAAGLEIEKDGPAEGLIRIFIRDPAGNRIERGQRT